MHLRSEVDPKLIPYVQSYQKTFNRPVNHITMKFANIPVKGMIAYCQVWKLGKKDVVFDKSYWRDMSQIERIALVYHELGHCEADLDHDDAYDIISDCPKSIMNSWMMDSECLNRNWDAYIKELDMKINNQ